MDVSFYRTESLIPCEGSSPLNAINTLFLDVDGTLTDGGIYYDNHGNELKKFSVKDGAGFFTAKACGIHVIVVTGRECEATVHRMKELHVEHLVQGVHDKPEFIRNYVAEHHLKQEQTAFVGDDLIDCMAMKSVGFCACPADSAREIMEIADYIAVHKGGDGAFREVIEYLLKERGQWKQALFNCYRIC